MGAFRPSPVGASVADGRHSSWRSAPETPSCGTESCGDGVSDRVLSGRRGQTHPVVIDRNDDPLVRIGPRDGASAPGLWMTPAFRRRASIRSRGAPILRRVRQTGQLPGRGDAFGRKRSPQLAGCVSPQLPEPWANDKARRAKVGIPNETDIGLGHYEGRGWRGFYHHAALSIATYGILVAERSPVPPSGALRQALFFGTTASR